jgi:hypothetical protein
MLDRRPPLGNSGYRAAQQCSSRWRQRLCRRPFSIQAFEEHGVMVPDDMSPVGFDDIQFAGFSRIGLTAVRQPRASMGQKVVQLVLNRLHGTEPWN